MGQRTRCLGKTAISHRDHGDHGPVFGGHLFSIHSEADNEFMSLCVLQWHRERCPDSQLGLTDEGHANTYTWTDGTPWTMPNGWAAVSPARGPARNQVRFWPATREWDIINEIFAGRNSWQFVVMGLAWGMDAGAAQ